MAKGVQKPPLPPTICHIVTRRRLAEIYGDFIFANAGSMVITSTISRFASGGIVRQCS
jgi:hypothetical protein